MGVAPRRTILSSNYKTTTVNKQGNPDFGCSNIRSQSTPGLAFVPECSSGANYRGGYNFLMDLAQKVGFGLGENVCNCTRERKPKGLVLGGGWEL